MLKDYRKLANKLTEIINSINYWPEIEFNQIDKEKIGSIPNVTFVNDHSIQLNIDGGNHTILPSQYILYAVCVKELAVDTKNYINTFEEKKLTLNQNQIAQQIIDGTLNYNNLNIDAYSKIIGPKIFTDQTLNLGAKSIVNGGEGAYKLRGLVDFFGSIILKPINIPNASSSILGKFIYNLTEKEDIYNYLENRFLPNLPFKIKDNILKNFCFHTISFLYSYDKLDRINKIIVKNDDPNFSSIKDGEISLTSIFKTSNNILSPDDLTQGGSIRNFEEPLFMINNEYYYLSTEWTNNGTGRLDLASFILLINKYYPEFKIYKDNEIYILGSSLNDVNSPNQKKNLISSSGNVIYYGSPGTGKSFKVNETLKVLNKKYYERITFHPEYDNSCFVGGYKPISRGDEIKYEFVPQVFTNIYTKAWLDLDNQYYLAIEEINRGNCAEIFGDIFQLLDRNSNYNVAPSAELNQHLIAELGETHEGIISGLKLPPNLSLLATMNTSDQSLFPMDSAFKRRWDWEYIPICYDDIQENESFEYKVKIDETTYFKWIDFIKNVNTVIKTNQNLGMDKCIGNYFIKSDSKEITLNEFINKAIFYLWNDVFKDEDSSDSIFEKGTSYEDFFPVNINGRNEIIKILEALKIETIVKATI